jgi:hypothetical protein
MLQGGGVTNDDFQILASWEGVIVGVARESFGAELHDLIGGDEPLFAEIGLDQVSEKDLERVQEGTIFRWDIGFVKDSTGRKRRESRLTFLQVPRTSLPTREAVRRAARILAKHLNWDMLFESGDD